MFNADNLALLREQIPLIDVRAPKEFEQGKMPNSVNMPILYDDERHRIGVIYKQQGQRAALKLGHKLVAGPVKDQRINTWIKQCGRQPDSQIMCWRGGQRSTLAQNWLLEAGIHQKRVNGGFKGLRQTCLEVLDNPNKNWWLISGRTGSAKTVIIRQLDNSIDLELRANHRGSAFGRRLTSQPMPISFQNTLATDYLNHKFEDLVVEDESRTIGSLGLPQAWRDQMQKGRITLVEVEFEKRVLHIKKEYVTQALVEAKIAGLSSEKIHQNYLQALERIKRRLGGLRTDEMRRRLNQAFSNQSSHESWISYLLSEYYDPMYDFQLSKKQQRIAFRGTQTEVFEFLQDKQSPQQP
jgi:tRNA 2-selenouridine synthase